MIAKIEIPGERKVPGGGLVRRIGLGLGLLVSVLAPARAVADVWTRNAGQAYVNLSVSRLSSDAFYGANFQRVDIAPYRQTTLGFYGEVGVIDRWLTVSVSGEVLRENVLRKQAKTIGLGDTRVGLFSGLLVSPLRVTAGVVVGLPTGDPAPSAGEGADEEATLAARSLPTGDGELDLEPRLALGWSFGGGEWPFGHYVIATAGYWLRTSGFHDAMTYRLELGTRLLIEPVDRLLLILRLTGVESFASSAAAAQSFSGLGNGVTYTAAGLELFVRVYGGFGLSASADRPLRGRGVISGIPLRFTASFDF